MRAGRIRSSALALLVGVPMALHAIALLPELRFPIPSHNDDAVHLLYVQLRQLSGHHIVFLDWGFPYAQRLLLADAPLTLEERYLLQGPEEDVQALTLLMAVGLTTAAAADTITLRSVAG